MVRTVISLDAEDKSWLDRRAAEAGVPMTEVVREAIRRMRQEEQESFAAVLERTRGTWRQGDGLEYQKKARRAWR